MITLAHTVCSFDVFQDGTRSNGLTVSPVFVVRIKIVYDGSRSFSDLRVDPSLFISLQLCIYRPGDLQHANDCDSLYYSGKALMLSNAFTFGH